MGENFIDYDALQRPSFEFKGNRRAIVEDTEDPDGVGRVRVRILGLHSLDPSETPVSHLPWAEPALSLYFGGGLNSRKNLNETIDNKDTDRYYPRSDLKSKLSDIPPSDTQILIPNDGQWTDSITDECGASAYYTVPSKGSVVWIFFEEGSHLRPHYWSAAPKAIDWTQQRNKIDEVIQSKRDELDALREKIIGGIDKDQHTDTIKPTERISVQTAIPDPKLFIHNLDGIRNEEITSYTTSFGTTNIIVNTNGEERTYMFHRGHSDYVDSKGQVKRLIGKSDNSGDVKRNESDSESSEQDNDLQEIIANNYDLHIIGDFNQYVHNNYYADIEKDCNIVVKRNVGIVVKEGDADILVKQGHVNISAPEGNVNIHCQELQAKVKKNAILEVAEDVSIDIKGDLVAHVAGSTNFNSGGDINLKTNGSLNVEATNGINMRSKTMDVLISSQVKIMASQLSLLGTKKTDITGASSNLNLTATATLSSVSTVDVSAPQVNVGGAVTLGAAKSGTPAEPAIVAIITIDAWLDWQENAEKVEKLHEPTEQVVTDEDSAT